MKNYNYRLSLSLLLMLILGCQVAFAQLGEKMRHHIIIAIDEGMLANKNGYWWPRADQTRKLVEHYLFKELVDGDKICRQGDIISIVGYGTTAQKVNMDSFVFPIGQHWTYVNVKNTKTLLNDLRNDWFDIANRGKYNIHKGCSMYSMVTMAKPYALAAFKNENYKQYVNRTFIIDISDSNPNGGTIYEEARVLPRISTDALLKVVKRVENEYFTYRHSLKQLKNIYGEKLSQYVVLWEFQPHQEHLTLSSMWNYKPTYEFKRGKSGKYTLNVADEINPNDHHKIVKLEYALLDKSGNVLGQPVINVADVKNAQYDPISKFEWKYADTLNQKAQKLRIRAWATLEDGIYNSTVLTPSEQSPMFLGKKGLCVVVPLSYEKAEKIWGVIPIPKFLMFIDNQQKMLWVLNIFVGAIILGLLIWLFRSLQTYRPKECDVKIRKIQ